MPQGVVCRQGKRLENQMIRGHKCVQTYRLEMHRLCHRALFTGKERDGKIKCNKEVSECVQTYHNIIGGCLP